MIYKQKFKLIEVSLLIFILFFSSNFLFSKSSKFALSIGFSIPTIISFDNIYSSPNWQHPYGFVVLTNTNNSKGKLGITSELSYTFKPGTARNFGVSLNFTSMNSKINFHNSSDFPLTALGNNKTLSNHWKDEGTVNSFSISLNIEKNISFGLFGKDRGHLTFSAGATYFIHSVNLNGSVRNIHDSSEHYFEINCSENKYNWAWNLNVDFEYKINNTICLFIGVIKFLSSKVSGERKRSNEYWASTNVSFHDEVPNEGAWSIEIRKLVLTTGLKFYL